MFLFSIGKEESRSEPPTSATSSNDDDEKPGFLSRMKKAVFG